MLTLHAALDDLARQGRRTPCQINPGPFTSDDRKERRAAALACTGCPVLDTCGDTADAMDEQFHIWGGRDRRLTKTKETP